MAGRPPKPTALKLLQGTARKDRMNGAEPQSPAGALCPPGVSGVARDLWNTWAPVYEAMGCLRQADALAFAGWMELEADMLALKKLGDPVPMSLRKVAINYAVQFGGTPSARARVHVEPKQPESKLERFRGAR